MNVKSDKTLPYVCAFLKLIRFTILQQPDRQQGRVDCATCRQAVNTQKTKEMMIPSPAVTQLRAPYRYMPMLSSIFRRQRFHPAELPNGSLRPVTAAVSGVFRRHLWRRRSQE